MPIHQLVRAGTYLRRLAKYIGPGFMIAVGYLDPGNWSVDFLGGSQFGYTLLFIILVSNIIAIFLQNLAIRLGTVSGLDLAAASRQYLPRPLNLFLYVLAETAIIATDIAEVIGSAIALNLLFPSLSLPVGVAITAADVFIILMFYKDEQDMQLVRYFEWFVMALVSAVGICFIIELALSPVVFGDVMKGFLPSSQIFTDPECLYVAIGIIGATVMPHNLFLHSFIVQSRCQSWRSERPHANQHTTDDDDDGTLFVANDDDDAEKIQDESIYMTPLNNDSSSSSSSNSSLINMGTDMTALRDQLASHVDTNLHYSFVDLVVALLFAFFINTAILVVASANFYSHDETILSDLFDAHTLLRQYIGPVAAFVFAIALLCAGQSSTLTATLAGQVVMSGFLGGVTARPWLRRLVTRGIAIIPAMVAAIWAGRAGLSQMLVASQVALSIQLPFAVVPLVYFTASPHIMKLDLLQEPIKDKPSFWFSALLVKLGLRTPKHDEDGVPFLQQQQQQQDDERPAPLTYANSPLINLMACLVAALLIGLNIYLVITTIV